MSDLDTLAERIQKDLKPFADPGSTVQWAQSGASFTADWEARGRSLSATFAIRARGEVAVHFEGNKLSYEQFLAHPLVGDLLGLAKMIFQTSNKALYIPTRAKGLDKAPAPALTVINECLARDPDADPDIRVVFITGDAGAGKTSVLSEIVRLQADRYLRGEVTTLYFYVNAQGRALARLDEALAVALQDLRAVLTYDALPALVRNGLIVPVVDGFDELLGVTGYDDAFSSLRRFIDDVEVGGQIVAAARSTYFEQEFLRRATAVPQPWQLIPVRVEEWGDEEFTAFLDARYDLLQGDKPTKKEFSTKVREYFDDPAAIGLRGKPFFVAKAAELALDSTHALTGGLVDQLASEYVERDRTEKLIQVGGAPILSRTEIEELFVFMAEEMWLQETRELDLVSVKDVAEIFLSELKIPASAKERVVQRSSKSAFFKGGRTANRVEFEHEALLSYFLSKALAREMVGAETARAFLGRGNLPPYAAQFAVDELYRKGKSPKGILDTLNAASATAVPRANRIKENAGSIATEVLNNWREPDGSRALSGGVGHSIRVSNVVFAGAALRANSAPPCVFENVEFRQVDFSQAKIGGGVVRECYFYEVLIDLSSTKLDVAGLEAARDFFGLRVRDGTEVRTLYMAREIADALRKVGAAIPVEQLHAQPDVDPDAAALVERLMYAFGRANVIWPADSRYARLVNDPYWSDIRRLLLEYELVEFEKRQHKGTSRESLRRRYAPSEVLAGVNPAANVPTAISEFWESLREKFPA